MTIEKLLHLIFGELDRQRAVLEAVAIEDVCKGWGDDGANTVVIDGPYSMLATRSASKIASGNQDRCVCIPR